MIDAVSLTMPRAQDKGAPAPQQSVAGDAPSFAAVFEQVSHDAMHALRAAEAASISAMKGDASTFEVVEAIKTAEQALHTATAVRDKVVQAYQEISRMAI